MRLKNTKESISMLDLLGTRYPPSLSLLFQLLNTDGNVLSLHEVRCKTPKKAIETLRRHGIVEISKDIVQHIYLIDSEVVEVVERVRKTAVKTDWKSKILLKGGNPEKVETIIGGDSRAAVFYRNELADNWQDTDEFNAYKQFVAFLWTGNFDEPFKRVLSIPSQVGYNKFIKTRMMTALPAMKDIVRNMENYTKKEYADLTQTLSKWYERSMIL